MMNRTKRLELAIQLQTEAFKHIQEALPKLQESPVDFIKDTEEAKKFVVDFLEAVDLLSTNSEYVHEQMEIIKRAVDAVLEIQQL